MYIHTFKLTIVIESVAVDSVSFFSTGIATDYEFLSVYRSESDVCNDDGCNLTVVWSEAIVSCNGTVSNYILTVTPPTCDCQSSPDCILINSNTSAEYMLSGSQTQSIITVNGSLVYDMTLRADTCDGELTGNIILMPSLDFSVSCKIFYKYTQCCTCLYILRT